MGRSRPNFSPKLEPLYRTSVYHDTHPPWGKYKSTTKEHMYMGVGNRVVLQKTTYFMSHRFQLSYYII